MAHITYSIQESKNPGQNFDQKWSTLWTCFGLAVGQAVKIAGCDEVFWFQVVWKDYPPVN